MVSFNGIQIYSFMTRRFLDARGELFRGLQVVEAAAGITSTLMGDKIEGICHVFPLISLIETNTSTVSKDMDTEVRRVPLGVCASIAPFNFPA